MVKIRPVELLFLKFSKKTWGAKGKNNVGPVKLNDYSALFGKFKVSNTAALWTQTYFFLHPAQIIDLNVYCNFCLLTETPDESLQS